MLLFDAHVHFYPQYNLEQALDAAWSNLSALIPQAPETVTALGLALTERADCFVFEELRDGRRQISGVDILALCDGQVLQLQRQGEKFPLHIFPGRQIVSKERIEVLALGKDLRIADGQDLSALLEGLHREGVTPCLPWSPGKWMGERGKLLKSTLENFHSQQILFGDILMRPWIFLEPPVFRKALNGGYRILGGSDPLPFCGEERNIGRMATLAIGDFSPENAANDFLKLLHHHPMIRIPEDGGFLGIGEFTYRMFRNEWQRRR
jgi:hypothetical protein